MEKQDIKKNKPSWYYPLIIILGLYAGAGLNMLVGL